MENAIRDIIASEKFAAKLKLSRLTLHRLPTFDHLAWVAVIDVTFLDSDFSNAPGHAHALKADIEALDGVAEVDVHADLTVSAFEAPRRKV